MIFNSFLPLPFYTPTFYNILLLMVLFMFFRLQTKGYIIYDLKKKEVLSGILLIFLTLYLGLRPISGKYFGDMWLYYHDFKHYASGGYIVNSRDFLWDLFMKFCSSKMTAKLFFLLCAFLYVVPLFLACKIWLGVDRYFLFVMLIASFSFWAYGTNGIRNGIATSIFILGLAFNNKLLKYSLLVVSYLLHASLIIPIAAYILSVIYKNPKHFLFGWLSSIPLSLIFGGVLESFFMGFGIAGKRTQYLNMTGFEDQFSSIGFRWDFLIYSAAAVFVGYYFIIKKGFKDAAYIQLFNIYVTANAFWILIIRATFSNRFAYLSWFLMALIIFYPFFKKKFFKKQQKVLAYAILVYFGFTYFMTMILK